jgi:4-hydroxybenzoate polyprenyltransferase
MLFFHPAIITAENLFFMRWLKQALELFIYGNIWISFAALGLYWQTQALVFGRLGFDRLALFVFCATVFLYCLHRLGGLKRVTSTNSNQRWGFILHYKNYLQVFSYVTGIASLILYAGLSHSLILGIAAPAVLSFAYALPIFPNRQRLRDIPGVKIFVLSITWSWVTVGLPILAGHAFGQHAVFPMLLERAFFIFSLAMVFDIRDMVFDKTQQAITLPVYFGVKKAKFISYLTMGLAILMTSLNCYLDTYSFGVGCTLVFTMLLGVFTLAFAKESLPEYYFSIWTDGIMLVQSVSVIVAALLF